MLFTGRREITTCESTVTRENVVGVLNTALATHVQNRAEIDYLWKYYKGDQPIRYRTKDVRPEICNKIVENRAYEIVNFKVGYLMGEPIQYVCTGEGKGDDVTLLNEYMLSEEKHSKDVELAEWMHVCGLGYRMVLPDPDEKREEEDQDAPYEIYTLDPRDSFVVRHIDLGKKPLMGVRFVKDAMGDVHFSCYTHDRYYEIVNNAIVRDEPHILGDIPIIEYRLNSAMLGAFESVISMLDAINSVESNALDSVEQFVQALMVFYNIDLSSDDFDAIRISGGLKVKDIDPQMKAKVEYLVNNMNQGETHVLTDTMYDAVLTICGMPNRHSGSASGGDNGIAVIYRDGWSAADAFAKFTESSFKLSERHFLRILLRICRGFGKLSGLKVWDIKIQFTRRNYENIQTKAQVLLQMLSTDKIHPKLAFEHCGMFPDPDLAYKISQEWADEMEKKAEEKQHKLFEQQKELGGSDGSEADTGTGGTDRNPAEARKSGGSTDRARQGNDSRDKKKNEK